jgi:23S rRNA pseudouridine2604 synthase
MSSKNTLKLPKPLDRSEPAKPPKSTRARRAQQQLGRSMRNDPPPPPAPVPALAPKTYAKRPQARTARPMQKDRKPPVPRRPDAERTPVRERPTAPRAPAHENPEDPRLSKRMTELGLCSRREADVWIENGWVKVDGKVVSTLGVRVSPNARIEVDRAATRQQRELVTILLNKPVGYVSGQPEDNHQPAVVLIKPENRWADDPSEIRFQPGHLRGLAPAGRLDIDSTGLLVFTQDGRVAKRLIGSDSEVEKEYLVRVEGTLSPEAMKLLQHGMELDGVKLKPARVSWANENQLRFVLREGRKRQIRRMCERVGLVVTGLKRVRSGGVPLGKLPEGQWRYLRRGEKF